MNTPRRSRNVTVAGIARVAVIVIASSSVSAAGLDSIPASSGAVSVESLGPPALIAGATGAWVLYVPTLSVDCSPPRGCYAKTQRIHYDFSCSPRYVVLTERVSMDINGNIVKHELTDAASGHAPSYDAGAFRMLDAFCPLPDRDYPR